jgi:hypothetical protein
LAARQYASIRSRNSAERVGARPAGDDASLVPAARSVAGSTSVAPALR